MTSTNFIIGFKWYKAVSLWKWFTPSSANDENYKAYDAHFGHLSIYLTFLKD